MKSKRDEDKYGTGFDDGLEPLVPLDVGKLDSVNALVSAMANTGYAWSAAKKSRPLVSGPCRRFRRVCAARTV